MKKITEYPETEELKDSDKIFVNYNGALRQISKKELLRGVMEVIDGLTADDVGAADAEHEHAIADVPGLQEALNNKAASNHVHTQYASTNHTHTGYASTNHTHGLASANMAGFMSAADKEKLDGMSSGGSQIAVDSALSDTSENPVQNKVVTSAINKGNYYKCMTAASSRVKEVKCPHFSFEEGAEITIEFYYGNTAENIDLSINGTVKGIALSSCNGGAVPKNLIKECGVYTFRYTTDHGLFILSSYISRITDSSAITEKKAYALDAIEKNASIQGTMANEIAKLKELLPSGLKLAAEVKSVTFTNGEAEVTLKHNVYPRFIMGQMTGGDRTYRAVSAVLSTGNNNKAVVYLTDALNGDAIITFFYLYQS